MQLTEFLSTVITAPKPGYFLLASGYNGTWNEHWFQYPSEVNEIIYKAKDLASKNQNVYFTSHLFKEPKSIKANVLPTDTIQADLDSADVHTLPVKPTIIVETSPGRYQAYWIVKKDKEQPLTAQGLEELSRRLTYSITDCDRSGWSLGHRVRLPDTFNYKYDVPHHIKILTNNPRRVPLEELQVLPDLDTNQREVLLQDISWADQPHLHLDLPPMLTMKELADENKIHKAVYRNYDKIASDRSTVLWRLLLELVKSGIGRDLTYWLAFNSANNKFKDRYNGVRDLRKDILRAESKAIKNDLDLRETIRQMRHDKQFGKAIVERLDAMAQLIINDLHKYGNFINAHGYSLFFVPKDSGRPINLHERSRYLSTLLSTRYGLNSATQEYKFIVAQITAYVHNLPIVDDIRVLAYHDDLSESMYLHLGMRDILHITDSNITVVNNGDDDVLFGTRSFNDPIQPDYNSKPDERKWFEELFSSSLDYIMSPTKERALAILSAWFLMILFRNSIHTRPILAILGQQGCIGADTYLEIKHFNHKREWTIREIYNKTKTWLHGSWRLDEPMVIRSLKDGRIKWRPIKEVVKSGIKTTYTVTVTGQWPIRTTEDHLFLTPTGYKALKELSTGDTVITLGEKYRGKGRDKTYRKEVSCKYHPYASGNKYVNGYGPYQRTYYALAVKEAELNNISVDKFIYIIRNDPDKARELKYFGPRVSVHHKDRDVTNNDPDNLQVMDKLDHDKMHGIETSTEIYDAYLSAESKIESIVLFGEEPTYDIVMQDEEAPNFLAHNIVLHNSGKSTLLRLVYKLIYGKARDLANLGKPDDYDLSVSHNPLVAFDNLDTFIAWLPNALATSTTETETEKRALYTDSDLIRTKKSAIVAVTAHSPKFIREDVVDRLLVIMLRRRDIWGDDKELVAKILAKRNRMWGQIIQDIQLILSSTKPLDSESPNIRMKDFATTGLWFARALNQEKDFIEGLTSVQGGQQSLLIETESLLVDALGVWAAKNKLEADEWVTPKQIWANIQRSLESNTNSLREFNRVYRNEVVFASKLLTMQSALKQRFDMDFKLSNQGTRVWRIQLKTEYVQ